MSVLTGLVLLFAPSVVLVPMIASRLGVFAAVLYSFWLLVGYLAAELGYGMLLYTFARFTAPGQQTAAAVSVAAPEKVSEKPATGTGHWWTHYDARPQEQETNISDGRS